MKLTKEKRDLEIGLLDLELAKAKECEQAMKKTNRKNGRLDNLLPIHGNRTSREMGLGVGLSGEALRRGGGPWAEISVYVWKGASRVHGNAS